jgi:hypothetical protein
MKRLVNIASSQTSEEAKQARKHIGIVKSTGMCVEDGNRMKKGGVRAADPRVRRRLRI